MRAYELMVLIDPEVDDRTVEPTIEKYLDIFNLFNQFFSKLQPSWRGRSTRPRF